MRIHFDSSLINNFNSIDEDSLERYIGRGFLDICASEKHTLVINQIVDMEFTRKQKENLDQRKAELENAAALFGKHGMEIDITDIHLEPISLASFFEKRRIAYEIRRNSEEIFQEGIRRCALHETPVRVAGAQDELRDVLIWLCALEDAQKNGKALLLSNDKVHTSQDATTEASESNLVTYKSFSVAVATETQLGTFCTYLQSEWERICESVDKGLPKEFEISKVSGIDYLILDGVLRASLVLALKKMPSELTFQFAMSGEAVHLLSIVDDIGTEYWSEDLPESIARTDYASQLEQLSRQTGIRFD